MRKRKPKLVKAAVKVGATLGKAEAMARRAKEAAEKKQKRLAKKLSVVARELEKSREHLKRAIARVRI